MPGSPYTNWFVVVFLVVVAIFLSRDESTRVALYVAPVWFIILGIGYQVTKRRNAVDVKSRSIPVVLSQILTRRRLSF